MSTVTASSNVATTRAFATRKVKICVVTPTLNARAYLQDCLDSVAEQGTDNVAVEHFVLDGGSSDGTREMLESSQVTMLPRERGGSLVQAMCQGYEQADGDLIGFLGADDVYLPGALSVVAEVWRKEQRPLVFGRVRWADSKLRSLGELTPPSRWLTPSLHASLGWNFLGAANTFVTPSLYQSLGGFDRRFSKAEDYEFFTRCLAHRIPFSRVNQTVCVFRRHGANDSLDQTPSYQNDLRLLQERYAPRSHSVRLAMRYGMKTWVYARHPQWAFHQLRQKLATRQLRA